MAYAPWISYQGDQHMARGYAGLAQGISSAGQSIAGAIAQYEREKEQTEVARAAAETALGGRLQSEEGFHEALEAVGEKNLKKFWEYKSTRADNLAMVNALAAFDQRKEREQAQQYRDTTLSQNAERIGMERERLGSAAAAAREAAALRARQEMDDEETGAALAEFYRQQGIALPEGDERRMNWRVLAPVLDRALAEKRRGSGTEAAPMPSLRVTKTEAGAEIATLGRMLVKTADAPKQKSNEKPSLTPAPTSTGEIVPGMYYDQDNNWVKGPILKMSEEMQQQVKLLRDELISIDLEIAKLAGEQAKGNSKPGPDWMPFVNTYGERITALRTRRALLEQTLAQMQAAGPKGPAGAGAPAAAGTNVVSDFEAWRKAKGK